jgi:hypothetical protein
MGAMPPVPRGRRSERADRRAGHDEPARGGGPARHGQRHRRPDGATSRPTPQTTASCPPSRDPTTVRPRCSTATTSRPTASRPCSSTWSSPVQIPPSRKPRKTRRRQARLVQGAGREVPGCRRRRDLLLTPAWAVRAPAAGVVRLPRHSAPLEYAQVATTPCAGTLRRW